MKTDFDIDKNLNDITSIIENRKKAIFLQGAWIENSNIHYSFWLNT